jgi:predicted Zn-dependent peptidase
MYLDQPQHLVHELLSEEMWPDHPLGRPLTGTEATLDSLDRKRLLAFRGYNYVAPALVISIAGNIDHKRVVRATQKLAPSFPAGKRPNFQQASCEQRKPRVRLTRKQTSQLQLALGFRVCSRHDERRFPLRVLNTILGENASSRLFQSLREEHGLTYCIHSGVSHFDDVGCLSVSAGLDGSDLEETMALIVRELQRFRNETIDAKELRQARDYLIGQMEIGLESTDNQMMWLGEQILGYGKIMPPEEIKRRIYEVKASEVRKVAKDFIRADRVTATVVSPLKNSTVVQKALVKLGV